MRLWDRWEHWREQPSASMCSWCLRSGKGRGGGTVDLKQTNSNIANMQTVIFSQELHYTFAPKRGDLSPAFCYLAITCRLLSAV